MLDAKNKLLDILKGYIKDTDDLLYDAYFGIETDFSSDIDSIQYDVSNAIDELEHTACGLEAKLRELAELDNLIDKLARQIEDELDNVNATIQNLSEIDSQLQDLSYDADVSKDFSAGFEFDELQTEEQDTQDESNQDDDDELLLEVDEDETR